MIKSAPDALIAFAWIMSRIAIVLAVVPFRVVKSWIRLSFVIIFQVCTGIFLYWLFDAYSWSAVWSSLTTVRDGTGVIGTITVGMFFLALGSPLITLAVVLDVLYLGRRKRYYKPGDFLR